MSSFSILNNIFFGRLKAANPQVEESINQSIIRLLIEEEILEKVLEIGMQFQVGTRGDRLSGGQRQKLAIARVLLKKPPVLILDEATSALDNKSQARIQGLLETHWKGRATMIAVAHRLDTVKNFDRIMVMKAGQIGESGTYTELMERRGLFVRSRLGRTVKIIGFSGFYATQFSTTSCPVVAGGCFGLMWRRTRAEAGLDPSQARFEQKRLVAG